MSKLNTKAVAIAMAAMLALAGVGHVMAATPSIDTTNDADSSTTSEWTDGTTLTGFNASADNSSYVEVSFDAAPDGQAALAIDDPVSGEEVYLNSSADTVNSTSNNYAWNISHDEFSELPMDANENKTFNVSIYDTQDEANATHIDVHFENTNERTVVRVGDYAADEDGGDMVSMSEKHPYLSEVSDRWDAESATVEDTGPTDGANTTFTYVLANDSVADSYANAYDDADDGTWLPAMSLSVEGNLVPVFANEKTDEWDYLDDDEAYGVYDSSSDTVTLHLAGDEDFEDKSEIDVETVGDEDMGFFDAKSMFEGLDASTFDIYTQSVKAV